MTKYVVYYIHCLITDSGYVGSTYQKIETRMRQHTIPRSSGAKLLQQAIEKYDIENFNYFIVDIAQSKDEMFLKETLWTYKMGTLTPNGHNILAGGPRSLGKETKKNSEPIICVNDNKVYESISEASRFYDICPGSISSIANGKCDKTTSGLKFIFLDEGLRSLCESERIKRFFDGQYAKEENYKRLSNSQKGKKSPRRQQVKCIETGKVFDSVSEADIFIGSKSGKVSSVASGKRDTVNGYSFEFLDLKKKEKADRIRADRLKNNTETMLNKISVLTKIKHKPVVCVETGIEFFSIKEAGKYFSCTRSNISHSIRTGGMAKGFHFKFKNNEGEKI